MYKFAKEQLLEPEFLTKLIFQYKRDYVKRYKRDQKYYEVRTEILKRTMPDEKPNNRIAHGFCRYITNMATSYFAGRPIRYQFNAEDEEYKKALLDVFDKNHINSLNFNVSKEASKKGIGYYLIFINEKSQLRIKKLDAEDIIPVYSTSLDEFLEAAVRIWEVYDIDGFLEAEYADVYDDKYIHHYKRECGRIFYEEYVPAGKNRKQAEEHKLSDVPVIVVWNNEEQLGDFEPHISINDAYDNAQSDSANDMDYFTDAYLCIAGASDIIINSLESDEEDEEERVVKNLRRNRILFLDEKGQAQFLTKQINDTATEHYKDRLYNDLFFLSQVPALSDESFSGNLTGIAIKYKLIGLEELATMKENGFRSAQVKMIKIITDHLNTKMNKNWDPDTVEQKYVRNFIENISDIINDVKNLESIVSKETQLDMLPAAVVEDTAQEMERIEKEALAAENLTRDLENI